MSYWLEWYFADEAMYYTYEAEQLMSRRAVVEVFARLRCVTSRA